MYEIYADPSLGNIKPHVVHRIEDGAWIPMDPNNGDYQAYLKWVAAGNVAPTVKEIKG